MNKKLTIIAIVIIGIIVGLLVSGSVQSFTKNLKPPATCSEARVRGLGTISADSIYYSAKLDRDFDGLACE